MQLSIAGPYPAILGCQNNPADPLQLRCQSRGLPSAQCRKAQRCSPRPQTYCRAQGGPGGRKPEPSRAFATEEATGDPLYGETARSELVNKEVVLHLFQQEFDVQLQRALHYENYPAAQEVRARRQGVDEAVRMLQNAKGAGSGAKAACRTEVADFAAEELRLRSEMNRAASEERYADAAEIRDRLAALQQEASALSAQWQGEVAGPRLRLGQRVMHSQHGYRAVVCGWDMRCCESEEWQEAAGVAQLRARENQVFYHLLVDVRDWEHDLQQPPVAYVAEELLTAPEAPSTWAEEHGSDPLQHPYTFMLFLGQDAAGDLLPSARLREKYSAPRRDVYPAGQQDHSQDDNTGPSGLDFGAI